MGQKTGSEFKRPSDLDSTGIENSYSTENTCHLSRKDKNDPKDNSEITGLTFPSGGQANFSSVPKRWVFSFSEARMLLPSASGVGPPSLSLGGKVAMPVSPEGTAAN